MPTKTRWGKLVAGALASLAGCTTSPAPPATPPAAPLPPPPVASAPASATLPSTTPALGPLVRALGEDKPGASGESWGEVQWVRYGRGMLRYTRVDLAALRTPPCPLRQGGPECGVFSISTTGKSPSGEGWRTSGEPQDAKKSALQAIPARWTALSPGKDGVYAFQDHTKKIWHIDDQGKVTTLLDDDALEQASVARIYEIGDRLLMLFNEEETRTLLAEIDPPREGRPGRRGKTIELPMAFVPGWRQSAQGIRQVEESKKMAMLGPPAMVALPGDKDAWMLVWAEGIAPPYNWPHDKPYKRKDKRGAKHECGGPSSRPLSDKSIEKRIHATRFKGLTKGSDVVLRSTGDYEEVRDLVASAAERGVEVNGVTYDDRGKELARRTIQRNTSPRLQLATDEQNVALAYDEASQQGLLLVRVGETLWRRSFDAQGSFLAPAVATRIPETLEARTVTRVDGRWYGLTRDPKLVSLEDDKAFEVKSEAYLIALVPQGPRKAMILAHEKDTLQGILVDLKTGQQDPPEALLPWNPQERPLHLASWIPATGPEPARVLSLRIDTSSRRFQSIDAAPLTRGASWESLWERGPTSFDQIQIHRVKGELVQVSHLEKKTSFHWLKSGKSMQMDGTFLPLNEPERRATEHGPMLRTEEGAWALLTSRPEVLVREENRELTDGCSQAIRTGPTTLVLVCGEAGEGDTPAYRLGLRRMTLPEGTP